MVLGAVFGREIFDCDVFVGAGCFWFDGFEMCCFGSVVAGFLLKYCLILSSMVTSIWGSTFSMIDCTLLSTILVTESWSVCVVSWMFRFSS